MIKLNPILQKEYRMATRSIKMIVIVLIFNAILAIFGFAVFYSIINTARYVGVIDYTSMINLYYVMSFIEFVMVALIVPAITSGAIAGEREKQTLDILLTTKMTPWRIVSGKLLSSIAIIMLLIISSFPILSLVFAFGGVTLSQLILMAFIMIVSASYIGSLSIMFSSILKKTSTASVASYGAVMIIYLGTAIVVGGAYLVKQNMLSVRLNQIEPDISAISTLLLINPAFTFYSWLSEVLQSNYSTEVILIELGVHNEIIKENWIALSLTCQIIISYFALRKSEKAIKPTKNKVSKRRFKIF